MNSNLYSLIARGNELAENTLYIEFFELNRQYVLKNNGNLEDVEDNYHEGLIIFIEKLRNGKLKPTDASPQYLLGICRKLWLKELGRRKQIEKTVTNLKFEVYIDDEVDIRFENNYSRFMYKALNIMEVSGKKNVRHCSELLALRCLDRISYDKLASVFNIKPDAVRQRVSRCMDKLKKISNQLEKESYLE